MYVMADWSVLSSCVAHWNWLVDMALIVMSDTLAIHMSSSVKSSSGIFCKGNCDMQLAAVLFTPGMYWMSKLYSNSRVDHLLILGLVLSLAKPFTVFFYSQDTGKRPFYTSALSAPKCSP